MRKNDSNAAYLYILPLLLMIIFIVLYPLLFNLLLSFYEWDGFRKDVFSRFAGFNNLQKEAHARLTCETEIERCRCVLIEE